MTKKLLAAAILIGAVSLPLQAAYTWNSVQIWGGGYVPGAAFHPTEKDVAYIRTDVGGSYRLNADKRSWLPLNDGLPFSSGNDMGSIAIGLDADDPNAVYVTGGLYLPVAWCGAASLFRSGDRGATWTKLPLNSTTVSGTVSTSLNGKGDLCLGGNADNRGTGNRIAARGNNIYLGTDQNGLLRSTDKGSTWSTVTAAPFTNTMGISAVQFDKDGNIYAAPFTGGIYWSANGTVWSRVGSFTGAVFQMSYSPQDNAIWFTTNASKPQDHSEMGGGSVYRLALGSETSFAKIDMPDKGGKDYGYSGVSVNPKDPSQILVSTGGWWKGTGSSPLDGSNFEPHEAIFLSMDGGQTWKDILLGADYDVATAYNAATHNPHWISALAVNPHDPGHVVFGTGYGVWSTFNATDETPEWFFTNRGIEETVPLGLVSTKYGAPLVSALGDIDGFFHADLDTPPLRRHKMEDGESEVGTNYDIDYAGQRPNYMVRIHKDKRLHLGAYSEDGGRTWKNFKSSPPSTENPYWPDPNTSGENNFVAVSADASAIVWNMDKNGVYYSTDNGATWTASSTGAALLEGFRPVADRVTAGTFYINNAKDGIFYRSTNNGASWTAVNSGMGKAEGDYAYFAFRAFASPDKAGEVWVAQGASIYNCPTGCQWSEYFKEGAWYGGPGGIVRSTNGGTAFSPVPGMLLVRSIGFGKGKNPGDPSAVYVAGMQSNGLQGVFRSDNNGAAWTRINSDANIYGEVTIVTGDPCVYSRVFLGTSGRGIVQGIDKTLAAPCDCKGRIDSPDYDPDYVSARNKPAAAIKKPALVRHGKVLRSTAPIQLYTLKGRMVASSSAKGPESLVTLNMSRVPSGVYIARSGTETLMVRLQK